MELFWHREVWVGGHVVALWLHPALGMQRAVTGSGSGQQAKFTHLDEAISQEGCIIDSFEGLKNGTWKCH